MREIVQKGPPPPRIILPLPKEYPAYMFDGKNAPMQRTEYLKVGLVDSQGRLVYTQRW